MEDMTNRTDTASTTHIYFLLDRSGSMAAMADDVIGGFNRFLADQQADGDDARMTLVQFDGGQPFEILTDALRISRVRPLTPRTFQPRGNTPLLDATGQVIVHASARAELRAALGKRPETIIVVTFTDGEENSSRRFTRHQIKTLVSAKQEQGWTFAFLGAGIDAYAESGSIGYAAGAVQAWAPDGTGAAAAFASLSRSTASRRSAARAGAAPAPSFFVDKDAEADRRRRRP